jgi:hypothetical protein
MNARSSEQQRDRPGKPPALHRRKKGNAPRIVGLGCAGLIVLTAVATILVIMHSGDPSELNDTWTWDGHDWQQISSSQIPTWRSGATYVYDEAVNQIVMFGGSNSAGDLSETWTWDGHWTLRHPQVSPPARRWAAAAYDPLRRNVVMSGGDSDLSHGQPMADTWTWDGQTWHRIATQEASPGADFTRPETAAFDPASGDVLVLVNRCEGVSFPRTCVTDTWAWDGQTWKKHASGTATPEPLNPYASSGILYTDSLRQRVVMLGGDFPLEWDGSKWSTEWVSSRLPARAGGGLAYDQRAAVEISFGGGGCGASEAARSSDDTWAWDGVTWLQLKPQTRPPARTTTYLAYDTKIKRIVMFGGYVGQGCSFNLL